MFTSTKYPSDKKQPLLLGHQDTQANTNVKSTQLINRDLYYRALIKTANELYNNKNLSSDLTPQLTAIVEKYNIASDDQRRQGLLAPTATKLMNNVEIFKLINKEALTGNYVKLLKDHNKIEVLDQHNNQNCILM